MSYIPRTQAVKLSHRIVDVILNGADDNSICGIIFELSEDWIAGKPLPIAERMALVACEAAQQMPEFIKDINTPAPETYFALERKYRVFGSNIPEYATNSGEYIMSKPSHQELRI